DLGAVRGGLSHAGGEPVGGRRRQHRHADGPLLREPEAVQAGEGAGAEGGRVLAPTAEPEICAPLLLGAVRAERGMEIAAGPRQCRADYQPTSSSTYQRTTRFVDICGYAAGAVTIRFTNVEGSTPLQEARRSHGPATLLPEAGRSLDVGE